MARKRTAPTPAELALMGLLTEGAAHPYALDAKLRAAQSPTEVAFSSIYAALDRLERLGMVTSRPDAGARGKARRVYRLTAQGRVALKSAALTSLAQPASGTRSNQLGVANLLLLTRGEALGAIAEAQALLAEEVDSSQAEAEYPQRVLALHRSLLLQAERRFYAELEKLVREHHPERARKHGEEKQE